MRRWCISLAVAAGLLAVAAPPGAAQGPAANVLIFSGTTGYRHDHTGEAIQPDVVAEIQSQLAEVGISSDYETCGNNEAGTPLPGMPGCRDATEGVPAIFEPGNLAQYDAIFFWQASSQFRGQPQTGPLFIPEEQDAIEDFAHGGGGIAAMHASVTMGAGAVTWPWWDGPPGGAGTPPGGSAIGALMPGHSATDINNVADVQVSDRNHPSTRDLPDLYELGDEHYTFSSNVRGTHHVLMTLDEETYNLGSGITSMGADHPIAWCRMYEGARVWASSLGHFAESYRENGFDNELMKHLVGGVEWAAGTAGADSDCEGTVWSNFTRTTLATGLNAAIGMDVSPDGKVYWTEIGLQGIDSQGLVRMWDPNTQETSTLLTLETRADYESSNAGVLGMALDPDFEQNRRLYVYYSPRVPASESNCTPQAANCVADSSYIPWHNVVSRFELNAAGDAVVPDSEQEILRVPRNAVGDNNDDGTGVDTYSAHQGGALSFDSEGNLYLGTGDDVDPFGDSGNYAPIDQRFEERYDARNTAANSNDLRGKVLRVHPLADASGEPGAGTTYSIPDGNMFEPGTPQTRPEIYAMGFRNPFTVQADPGDPGTVVVGEYGPDATSDNASRGPAGVIEWDRITEPGFFGWPLCVGDNSNALSYNRYEFPSGPAGTRFDCSAAEIPNESPNNTGLAQIPGPAVAADVWAKHGGGTPARFNIPGGANEANTGPVYRFDPDNPSDTKWPRYFDGSWLIFNRGSNWWREARVRDDGSGLLRVNGFFQPNQFGSPDHNFVVPTRFGPDGSLYLVTWSGGCCRSGLPGLGAGTLMRIDFTGEGPDTAPPDVSAELSGTQSGDDYVGRATLDLSATDASGVDSISYRVNSDAEEDWQEYDAPVVFDEPGEYAVDYRATDTEGNTSEIETITFTVVPGTGCVPARSDEFDGDSLDAERWSFLHPTTPSAGAGSPSVSGGSLHLPLGAFSVDLDRPGPIGFVGQPLPEEDFTLTTEVSAPGLDSDVGGQGSQYAQVGLKVFQTDNDWIKIAHTRNNDGAPPGSAPTYLEMTYEDGGSRVLGDRSTAVEPPAPTVWFRVIRTANEISADYSLTDPDEGASWTPLTFGAGSITSVNADTVFGGGGPVYIGAYGGNGSATAHYDYIRFEPDDAEGCDETPPTTTATLDPPGPGPHDGPVEVTLSATDGEEGSGVAATMYSLDGDEAVVAENDGDEDPFVTAFEVTDPGEHVVAFASTDGAENDEEIQTVAFEIAEPEPPGEPELGLSVKPKRRKVTAGKESAFTATLANTGEAAASGVELCARAPKRLAKLKGKPCVTAASLDPDQEIAPKFTLKPTRKARGKKVKVTFTATALDVDPEIETATLKVKR